jgi:hypothetical protein
MRLSLSIALLVILLSTQIGFSQTKDTLIVVSDTIKVSIPKKTTYWVKKNTVGFDLNQIAFVNWSAGGVSSISGLLKGVFLRKYDNNNLKWSNELIARYGINKQDGVEFRKTDDAFQFTSTLGYRKDTISNWYYSTKFSFNTQFTPGYDYPNVEMPISGPFAPAYTFFGVGAEYSNKEKLINIYLSPMTLKNTMVFNQRLANQGAFGVTPAAYDLEGNKISGGQQSKTEFGMLVTAHVKKEILKNINLENRLSLYSDYINKFGNIDIDWGLQLDLVVNEYVKANIGTHLIYDDDIKVKKEIDGQQITTGPRIQLKQLLGIGVIYNF